ncbi:MAG: biotin synthase BioB [Planctomycetaceae bacterium]|jgi:biotin synthase|nr:biotin synthase BioB [Planctomycetaceae bacterium]
MQFTLDDIVRSPLEIIFDETERIRNETFGDKISFCGIVNIKSGKCRMNCRFCAQSGHHQTNIETYPLRQSSELAEATRQLWQQGVSRVGWVASGPSPAPDELDQIIASAESVLSDNDTDSGTESTGTLCCASLGQLHSKPLERLKTAGFRRYHHNLETSERFYPSICTTQRWQDRFATVERVKNLGWEICSGGLFGLGESWQDRWDLAMTLKHLEVDSVPLNFYNAVAGTPFADRPPLSMDEALRIVALFRTALPKAAIRICGGRPKIFAENSGLLFRAGADALMTGNYLTTTGVTPQRDKELIQHCGLRCSS